jgi:hypothetical protein
VVAEAFMHILHALFGAPEQVAKRHTLLLPAHQLMASWLRAGEAMMRRLLLIEAAAFAKPNARPLLRSACKRARKLMTSTPDAPEKWRVSFRCFVGDTHARRAASRDDRSATGACVSPAKRVSPEDRWCSANWKPVRLRSAWPLAERYEALLRVFNDPAPYARRLHAKPHRVREVLRPSLEAAPRVDRYPALCDAAETQRPLFNST